MKRLITPCKVMAAMVQPQHDLTSLTMTLPLLTFAKCDFIVIVQYVRVLISSCCFVPRSRERNKRIGTPKDYRGQRCHLVE